VSRIKYPVPSQVVSVSRIYRKFQAQSLFLPAKHNRRLHLSWCSKQNPWLHEVVLREGYQVFSIVLFLILGQNEEHWKLDVRIRVYFCCHRICQCNCDFFCAALSFYIIFPAKLRSFASSVDLERSFTQCGRFECFATLLAWYCIKLPRNPWCSGTSSSSLPSQSASIPQDSSICTLFDPAWTIAAKLAAYTLFAEWTAFSLCLGLSKVFVNIIFVAIYYAFQLLICGANRFHKLLPYHNSCFCYKIVLLFHCHVCSLNFFKHSNSLLQD